MASKSALILLSLQLFVQLSSSIPVDDELTEVIPPVEEENCVPLSTCDPLLYLVNAIRDNNIPEGHTRSEIVQHLRSTMCRIEDSQVIVNCPPHEVEFDVIIRHGGAITGRDYTDDNGCEGSLQVHMTHPERGVVVRPIRGTRRNNVANIPGFSESTVFRVEVQGNCCWELFPSQFRRGTPQLLDVGFDGNPRAFRSLQKTECRN